MRAEISDLRERVAKMEVQNAAMEGKQRDMDIKLDRILDILSQAKGWRAAFIFIFGAGGLATILALFDSVRGFFSMLFK